jgi:RNA polymerase sigma factor (sigma-70 family)
MDEQAVIEWLGQIAKLDVQINDKEDEIARYMDNATKMTANIDGMPHCGGVSDKVGDNAIKIAELSKEKEALKRQKDYIIKTLKKLPPDEFGVLYREFVRQMSQVDIAFDIGFSRWTVWRIRKDALKNLAKLL